MSLHDKAVIMEKIMRLALIILFLAFFTQAVMAADEMAPTDRGPAVGTIIPSDLASVDQNGKARTFETLTGENGLVLVFFRSAKWCPYCKRQLIDIATKSEAILSRGYGLAALSYDSVDILKRFDDGHKLGYTLLSDQGSKIIDTFGLRNEDYKNMAFAYGVPYPMIFIISPDKMVLAKLAEEGYKDRPPVGAIVEAINALSASTE